MEKFEEFKLEDSSIIFGGQSYKTTIIVDCDVTGIDMYVDGRVLDVLGNPL